MYVSRFSPFQFATLRAYGRARLLASDRLKKLLLERFQETKKRFHLTVAGYVILDDHAHFLFSIPGEYECTVVLNDLRAGFLREWRKNRPLLEREQEDDIPFWERDLDIRSLHTPEDLRAYLDFIHYDPVRHGLTRQPGDYRWSSLPARISQGHYPEQWGMMGPPATIAQVLRGIPALEI